MAVEVGKERVVVVRSTEEERVVDVALLARQQELLVESLQRGGLRHGVRHLAVGGDTAESGRAAFAFYVGLLGESWFAEMHMGVDDTGNNKSARGIDDLVESATGLFVLL